MERPLVKDDVMYLKDTLLKKLPNKYTVTRSLDLTDSIFEELPDDMLIYKDLIIGNSKIKSLPKGLKIGRDLIMKDSVLGIPPDIVIGGRIVYENTSIEPPFQKDSMIITDDGKRVTFRKKKICHEANQVANDYFYPEVYYYFGIDPKNSAIEFTENDKHYLLSCTGVKDGFRQVDWIRAKNFGVDYYKDYNIDSLRTVDELKTIYQTCTGACESGIKKFKEELNVDDNKLYTIRQLGKMVESKDWVNGPALVFFEFFDLPCDRLRKEEDAD